VLNKLNSKTAEYEQLKTNYGLLNSQNEENIEDYNSLVAKYEKLESKYKIVYPYNQYFEQEKALIEKVRAENQNLKKELKQQNRMLLEFNQLKIQLSKKTTESQKWYKKYCEQIKRNDELASKNKELENQKRSEEFTKNQLTRKVQDLENQNEFLFVENSEYKKKMKKPKKDGFYEQKYKEIKNELSKQKEDFRKYEQKFESQLEKANNEIKSFNDEFEKYGELEKIDMGEYIHKTEFEELYVSKSEFDKIKTQNENAVKELSKKQKIIEKKEADLSKKNEEIQSLKSQVESFRDQMKELSNDEERKVQAEKLEDLKWTIETYLAEIENKKEEFIRFQKEKKKKIMEEIETERNELKKEKKQFSDKKFIFDGEMNKACLRLEQDQKNFEDYCDVELRKLQIEKARIKKLEKDKKEEWRRLDDESRKRIEREWKQQNRQINEKKRKFESKLKEEKEQFDQKLDEEREEEMNKVYSQEKEVRADLERMLNELNTNIRKFDKEKVDTETAQTKKENDLKERENILKTSKEDLKAREKAFKTRKDKQINKLKAQLQAYQTQKALSSPQPPQTPTILPRNQPRTSSTTTTHINNLKAKLQSKEYIIKHLQTSRTQQTNNPREELKNLKTLLEAQKDLEKEISIINEINQNHLKVLKNKIIDYNEKKRSAEEKAKMKCEAETRQIKEELKNKILELEREKQDEVDKKDKKYYHLGYDDAKEDLKNVKNEILTLKEKIEKKDNVIQKLMKRKDDLKKVEKEFKREKKLMRKLKTRNADLKLKLLDLGVDANDEIMVDDY
jgi:hypothetical protein